MSAYPAPWAICGGWAVDAWLGRHTRSHGDVDIFVFVQDQQALLEYLADWQLVAHDGAIDDGSADLWDGRPLRVPGHLHGRLNTGDRLPDMVDSPAEQGFGLDIQLNDRSGDEWVLSREPRITMPLRGAIQQSPWGLPTAAPEVLLFFKALDLRRRDKLDFAALLPVLTQEQRDWLRDAIETVGHPWVSQLS